MSIKNLLTKIWATIQSLFNNFPADLKTAVHIGVSVTQNIKSILNSPDIDILTALIPGDIDDKVKQALRSGIPIILFDLKLADTCSELTDPQEITICAIKALQSLDGDIKSAFLHTFSVLVTQLAADGKLSWGDAVCIVEWYYQHRFETTAS
jgi:hypothetical protein